MLAAVTGANGRGGQDPKHVRAGLAVREGGGLRTGERLRQGAGGSSHGTADCVTFELDV